MSGYVADVMYRVEALLGSFPLAPAYEYAGFHSHLLSLQSWVSDRGFEWPRSYSDQEAVARFQDEGWVRKYIRTQLLRQDEENLRRVGMVSRRDQEYCSALTRHQVLDAQASFLAHAETVSMVSSSGARASLLDLINSSTANPENRRAEMMVRIKGLEELATAADMVALFLTNTVPGRMHPTRYTGLPNRAYDGSTVRDCQAHLSGQWIRHRARCAKDSIEYFGLRVAEPHHDGTPHWHTLVFVRRDQVDAFLTHFRAVSVEGSEGDRGAFAARHRYKVVFIDRSKGSAVGYVAKYISKNVDGVHVGEESSAASVRAWASRFGIRQFQFFGAASVQLWREARRLGDDVHGQLGLIRDHAKSSDYAAFCSDVLAARLAGQPLQLVRQEPCFSRFGDLIPGRVLGLELGEEESAQTRHQRWARASEGQPEAAPWTRLNNCNPPSLDDVRSVFTDSEDLDRECGWSDEQEFFPNLERAGALGTTSTLRQ